MKIEDFAVTEMPGTMITGGQFVPQEETPQGFGPQPFKVLYHEKQRECQRLQQRAAVAEDALARLTPLAIIGARHNHEDCIEAVGSHPSGLHYGSFELCENKNCVLVRTPAPDRSLPDPES